MYNPLRYIKRSLSLQVGLYIVGFATVVFIISMGYMFVRSRQFVRTESIQSAQQTLDNTALRVENILNEVEIATNATEWLQSRHLVADSARVYSRRIIESNPRIHGCSISFEPNFFSDKGRYYSIFSSREQGRVMSKQQGNDNYRYHEMEWYTIPKMLDDAAWIDPYFDGYWEDSTKSEMITSFAVPILDNDHRFVGVFRTNISLDWLSKQIINKIPIPGAYCIMVGKDGDFFIHPDSTKLANETVFTGLDPDRDADRLALANNMVKGKTGTSEVNLNGEDCYVFYRPIEHTGWSLALVCPEDALLATYNRLYYVVVGIIVFGLVLLLVLCRFIINRHLRPVNRLALQARRIAAGHFDEVIPHSGSTDSLGRLQNVFSSMQESISSYVNEMNMVNQQIEKRNEELATANKQMNDAISQKTAFMQDITHQVRTPLNIVIGFAQVLSLGHKDIPKEELFTITEAMRDSSLGVKGIVEKLYRAMSFERLTDLPKRDEVKCNALCREVVSQMKSDHPHMLPLHFVTSVKDDFAIQSHEHAIAAVVRQMLDNAFQFTRRGCIVLDCRQEDYHSVSFIVTDTGIGVDPDQVQKIFDQFYKIDYYGEGLGIGLHLCRRSAELLGGVFKLDTAYKGGARFVFTLPLK